MSDPEADAPIPQRRRILFDRRLVWLAYLLLYPTPWFFERPSPLELGSGVIGVAAFLIVYIHELRTKRAPLIHALASVAIGFALSPFGGAWSVFNVYGASFAARARPRRRATAALIALQILLAAFGLVTHQPWPNWVSGLFFGALIGFGVLWQTELEEQNRRLQQAQGEVRALATTAERERIARDLHDLLGHTLTVVAIKAELADKLCGRDVEAARREMQELAQIAREALAEVRAVVVGMKGASLASEVRRAERALGAAGVQAHIHAAPDAGDPQQEAVITMALREAVTNVIRHAGAETCTIQVESRPDGELRLSVSDDGRGGALAEGFGLTGMRTRLEAAGGRLMVESGAQGVQLMASLPKRAKT
jgi:two-component system sensor histidine kinase DesK